MEREALLSAFTMRRSEPSEAAEVSVAAEMTARGSVRATAIGVLRHPALGRASPCSQSRPAVFRPSNSSPSASGLQPFQGSRSWLLADRAALVDLRQPLAPWLLAFCGLFFYHALYFYALSAAPPAQASILAYLWPLLIVLLSAAAAGRRPSAPQSWRRRPGPRRHCPDHPRPRIGRGGLGKVGGRFRGGARVRRRLGPAIQC